MGFLNLLKTVIAPLVGGLLKSPPVKPALDLVIKTIQNVFGGHPTVGASQSARPVKITEDPALERRRQDEEKRQSRLAQKLKALDEDIPPRPVDALLPSHSPTKWLALEETELYPEKHVLLPVGRNLHWLVNPEAKKVLQMLEMTPGIVDAALRATGSPKEAFEFLLAKGVDLTPEELELLLAAVRDSRSKTLHPQPKKDTNEATIFEKAVALLQALYLKYVFDVNLTTDDTFKPDQKDWRAWVDNPKRANEAFFAVLDTAAAFKRAYDKGELAPYFPKGLTTADLFRTIMGPLTLQLVGYADYDKDKKKYTGAGAKTEGLDPSTNRILIIFYKILDNPNFVSSRWNIVHEFGHVLNVRTGSISYGYNRGAHEQKPDDDFIEAKICETDINQGLCQQHEGGDDGEQFADRFLFWVYDDGDYTHKPAGVSRFKDQATYDRVNLWMVDTIKTVYEGNMGDAALKAIVAKEAKDIIDKGKTGNAQPNPEVWLYDAPDTLSPLIEKLYAPTSMDVFGKTIGADDQEWLFVIVHSHMGWVLKRFVILKGDVGYIRRELFESLTGRCYDEHWKRVAC